MQLGTKSVSEFRRQLVFRRLLERNAKFATQFTARFQLLAALRALLQMRDDSVIRFDYQLVAEVRIDDFPKFPALHVKASSMVPSVKSDVELIAQSRGHWRSWRVQHEAICDRAKCATSPYQRELQAPTRSPCKTFPRCQRGSLLPGRLVAIVQAPLVPPHRLHSAVSAFQKLWSRRSVPQHR